MKHYTSMTIEHSGIVKYCTMFTMNWQTIHKTAFEQLQFGTVKPSQQQMDYIS